MLVRLAAVLVVLANGVWPHPVKNQDAEISGRVYQGKVPAPGQFKSLVTFRIPLTDKVPWCTGSIISARFVLSARHCFEFEYHVVVNHPEMVRPEYHHIEVITGSTPSIVKFPAFTQTDEIQVRLARFKNIFFTGTEIGHDCDNVWPFCNGGVRNCHIMVCQPNAPNTCIYKNSCTRVSNDYINDIALVNVEEQFDFNEFVGPLPLLGDWDSVRFVSSECIALGYGENKLETADFLDGVHIDLYYADVTAGGHDYCMSLFEWNTFSHRLLQILKHDLEKSICSTAEIPGKQICNSDAGGPVICKIKGRDVVVGELRHAYGYGTYIDWYYFREKPCGHNKTVGLYASTGSFMDWIKSVTEGEDVEFISSSCPALSDSTWLASCMLLRVTMLLLN